MVTKIIGMCIGLLLPVLPGLLLFSAVAPDVGRDLRRSLLFVVSFAIGHTAFALLIFLAMMAGMRFTLPGAMLVWLLFTGLAFVLFRARRSQPAAGGADVSGGDDPGSLFERILRGIAVGLTCSAFLVYFIISMMNSVSTQPELAIWALKAKVFFLSGLFPNDAACNALNFLTAGDRPYAQMSYPPGFALFISWLYLWMGGVDDYLIRLVPPILGILAAVAFYGVCRHTGLGTTWSWVIVCLLVCGRAFMLVSIQLYAELMLMLCAAPAFLFLLEYVRAEKEGRFMPAVLLLSAGAWIKNEGLLLLVVSAGMAILFRRLAERGMAGLVKDAAAALVPILVFVAPWLIFRKVMGIELRDFEITAAALVDKTAVLATMAQTAAVIGRHMFVSLDQFDGAWALAVVMSVTNFRRLVRDRGLICLLVIAVVGALIYIPLFVFSTRELGWHLVSVPRILLAPSALALLCAASCATTWWRPGTGDYD